MVRTFLIILSVILIVIGFGPFVQAQSTGPITVENAYAFATPPAAPTGAVFMTIKNSGSDEDSLVSVQSDVAEINEIHENFIDPDDGHMMMRKINAIVVPSYDQVMLDPAGKHIMLIKLKNGLTEGHRFSVALTFEKAGVVSVPVDVVAPGVRQAPEGMKPMDHMEHHGMEMNNGGEHSQH